MSTFMTSAEKKLVTLNQTQHNQATGDAIFANPELIKDKLWRMENLYWIITKDGKKSVFKMNRAQRHFFDNYLNIPYPFYRNIILKSRQLGFTTFIDIYILDEILFNTNKEGIIIAHKLEDATEIFDKKIDFAIRNMSEEIKQAFFKLNRNSSRKIQVTLDYGEEEGSTSSIAVGVSGRSGTYHYVHISEFAKMCVMFPKRAEEVITGTFPAVPLDGSIFIESTAEGMAGSFYEMFNQNWLTRDKISPQLSRVLFMPHFYNWQYDDMEMKKIFENVPVENMDICPEIDWGSYQKEHNLTDKEITYYYMKWLQLGGKNSPDAVKKLLQEYPTTVEEAFLSTGQCYFPTAKVASLLLKAKPGTKGELIPDKDGVYKFYPNSAGCLEIFKAPEMGIPYVVGGDTSEGLAHGDAQVLVVINQKTEEIDAIYRSQVDPADLAKEAYQVGKFYNWALLAIEVNKDGLWVNDALEKMGYINLYYRKAFDDITQKITKLFGWKTTSATRPFSLAALKAIFIRKDTGFPAALLNEMFTFIRNAKGRPEAMDKKHDDCFIKNTMILTDTGNRPIQNIKVGDLVMTRNGLKPVEFTRSRFKKVISKIGLIGTPAHKIIIKNNKIELLNVSDSDTLYIWNNKQKQIERLSYIEAKNIIDIQTQNYDKTEYIFGDMMSGRLAPVRCIGRFGLIIMDRYQKVMLSTIRIITLLIIHLKIWNLNLLQNIVDNTWLTPEEENYKVRQQRSKEQDFMKQEQFGGKPQKELPSIEKMSMDLCISKKNASLLVEFVKKSLNHLLEIVYFVQTSVVYGILIIKTEILNTAKILFALIARLFLNLILLIVNIVLKIVDGLLIIGNLVKRRKVYNLQVADTHEYFANGILVSNCIMASSIGYAVLQEQGKYVESSQPGTGTSIMKTMFGE